MSFFKLLLSFAPWLSFLIIARESLFRLKIGLLIALALTVIMGIARLQRGIILWVGLFFFACASLAVVVFNNMWAVQHMGILANGTLALFTWLTILIKKPFTIDYARDHTDPSLWNSPRFMRANIIISSVWGATFTACTLLSWGKMEHIISSEIIFDIIAYALLIGTMIFTSWYPNYLKHRREQKERELKS